MAHLIKTRLKPHEINEVIDLLTIHREHSRLNKQQDLVEHYQTMIHKFENMCELIIEQRNRGEHV